MDAQTPLFICPPPRVTAIIYGNNFPWNGGGKEADEEWASSQHVYIAYMMVGKQTPSAAGGKPIGKR